MSKQMLVFVLVALSTSTALFGAPQPTPTPKHVAWWREAHCGSGFFGVSEFQLFER